MTYGADSEADLLFYDQQDGKRVGFVGTKCAILDRVERERVGPGERWRVRLVDKGAFYIAFPIARLAAAVATPAVLPAPRRASSVPVAPAPPPPGAPGLAKPAASAVPAPPPAAARAPSRDGPLTLQGMLLEPDNVIKPGERVAFFVDAANTDKSCSALGFFLDWRKTLGYFLADGLFAGAYYFAAAYMDDEGQTKFHDQLSRSGFTVRVKPVKVIEDIDSGERLIKGNVDIELALEMVAAAEKFDVAYLFSGDSDFTRVVEILQGRGKRVFVVSTRRRLSRELGYAADKPTWLIEDFSEQLRQA